MSQISSDDVRKVAQLARLDLPEDKIATYTGQLESILEYVGQLQQVDTEGVPETTRAVEVTNVTRADGVQPTLFGRTSSTRHPKGKATSSGFRKSWPTERDSAGHPPLWLGFDCDAVNETEPVAA